MGVKVDIIHQEKLIKSFFDGVMSPDDMQDYFERFIEEIEENAQYYELVDLTAITEFDITQAGFLGFTGKAEEVFKTGRVATTEFLVANELQMGMARMFASMAEAGMINFVFTKI